LPINLIRTDFSRWKGIYKTWQRCKQVHVEQISLRDLTETIRFQPTHQWCDFGTYISAYTITFHQKSSVIAPQEEINATYTLIGAFFQTKMSLENKTALVEKRSLLYRAIAHQN
jgi:hypothetical protein